MTGLSKESIKAELERVLASRFFADRQKPARFLGYVVEQSLANNSRKVKQFTIAVEALGYGPEFNPATNPSVRILAQRVRRALEQYYAEEGTADPIRIEIPRGTYVPTFVANAPDSAIERSPESPSPITATTARPGSTPTIAVFEFENLNGLAESDHVARGLTGEIITYLTRFAGFTVLGPLVQTDSLATDLSGLSRNHGAAFALKGWIRGYGSIIRITIDLIDASNGSSPWGETFEYDLAKTSLFEIEDEVTSHVVGVVADGLGIVFQKLWLENYPEYIKFTSVTNAVLFYNNAWMTQAPTAWRDAYTAVTTALVDHPRNALLLALHSNVLYADALHWLNIDPDARSKMYSLATKAIALDPALQIARYNLVVQNAFAGQVDDCVIEAQKTWNLNPNHARVIAGCAVALTSVEEYDLGLQFIQRARRLNPHYPGWYHFIEFLVYFADGRYEEAWRQAERIHVDGLLWHPIIRGSVLGKLGRVADARPYVGELLMVKPDFVQRPHDYLRALFVTDKHVELIWDGLLKAGIREEVSTG